MGKFIQQSTPRPEEEMGNYPLWAEQADELKQQQLASGPVGIVGYEQYFQ